MNQRSSATLAHSLADALVTKDDNLALLVRPGGDIPIADHHGLGLYYRDCRYLDGYELRLGDRAPVSLLSTTATGYEAEFELTNPDMRGADDEPIRQASLRIRWARVLDASDRALREIITVHNHAERSCVVPLSLRFSAEFEDVFVVRGMTRERPGTLRPPRWRDGALVLRYDGADDRHRLVTARFSPPPDRTRETTASFRLPMAPGESRTLRVNVLITETASEPPAPEIVDTRARFDASADARRRDVGSWLSGCARIRSSNRVLDDAISRAFRDLAILRSRLDGLDFYAAGVPWFITLFGRDSLVAALQTVSYERDTAARTLRLLARLQGSEVNDRRDEQPGKILHELRTGELARLDRLPVERYYGTVDATPLFLVLLSRHAAWTGELSLFHELRPNIERALAWLDRRGETNDDGFIAYRPARPTGLYNHGWKDSSNAIVLEDGGLAEHPIALVEVQGYAYLAKRSIAGLFERSGESGRARSLRDDAERLRARFDRRFWMPDRRYFALALQGPSNRPARVISSNPGQALWTGIVDRRRAGAVAERLMADDMFTGWGVRTLSADETCYNPIGYHLGTVWPHDNSIIAAGLRRYGFDDEATRIFGGLLDAVGHFDDRGLPELFAGLSRDDTHAPVHYPVACHPQAWAAASIPFMLETMLGIRPDAFERRLRLERPILPEGIDWIEMRDIGVGDAAVDLRFERGPSSPSADVRVLRTDGDIEVSLGR